MSPLNCTKVARKMKMCLFRYNRNFWLVGSIQTLFYMPVHSPPSWAWAPSYMAPRIVSSRSTLLVILVLQGTQSQWIQSIAQMQSVCWVFHAGWRAAWVLAERFALVIGTALSNEFTVAFQWEGGTQGEDVQLTPVTKWPCILSMLY